MNRAESNSLELSTRLNKIWFSLKLGSSLTQAYFQLMFDSFKVHEQFGSTR